LKRKNHQPGTPVVVFAAQEGSSISKQRKCPTMESCALKTPKKGQG